MERARVTLEQSTIIFGDEVKEIQALIYSNIAEVIVIESVSEDAFEWIDFAIVDEFYAVIVDE
jgi:hypothetical protein